MTAAGTEQADRTATTGKAWSEADLKERILGGSLEKILADLETRQFASFSQNARAYLLRTKRMDLVRARLLEAVSDMPVFDTRGIVHRIQSFLPDAFGSEVVNFSEYIGDAHKCHRRESDTVLKDGKNFRNSFGDFGHPVFEEAAREQKVVCAEVTEGARRKDRYRTASFMAVPLVVQQRTFGIFSFADKKDKAAEDMYGQLDEEEIGRFARTLGNTLTDKVEKSHDGLTGILNRTHFVHALGDMLFNASAAGSPVSLFYLDLDHFKLVNDTFGHAAGDQVLMDLAQILRGIVRYEGANRDLVARMGGEEFCVALPISVAQSSTRARVLHQKIKEHDFKEVGPQTASIGVRTWIPGTEEVSVDELLRQVDAAMYYRKEHGRDGVTRYEEI